MLNFIEFLGGSRNTFCYVHQGIVNIFTNRNVLEFPMTGFSVRTWSIVHEFSFVPFFTLFYHFFSVLKRYLLNQQEKITGNCKATTLVWGIQSLKKSANNNKMQWNHTFSWPASHTDGPKHPFEAKIVSMKKPLP